MSGPKAYEIEALRLILQRQTATQVKALKLAIARWQEEQQRTGNSAEDFQASTAKVLKEIEDLGSRNQWREALQVATQYRTFFEQEAEQARTRWMDQRRKAVERVRRLQSLAVSLLQECEDKGIETPEAIRDAARHGVREGADTASLDAAIAQVMATLDAQVEETVFSRPEVQAFASALADGKTTSYESWLQDYQRNQPEDKLRSQLDALLAGVRLWCSESQWESFEQEARNLYCIEDTGAQTMRINSLILKVSQAKCEFEEAREARELLEAALAELEAFTSEDALRWKQNIERAIGVAPLAVAQKMYREVESFCAAEAKAVEAAARRQAVLSSLAELGYEVEEGMETALAEDGRIVMRESMGSGYGLELTVPKQGQLIGTRVVAFRNPGTGSKVRDKEKEESWCSTFAELRKKLEEEGFTGEFKSAKEPGQVAVKEMEVTEADEQRGTTQQPKLRQMKPGQ